MRVLDPALKWNPAKYLSDKTSTRTKYFWNSSRFYHWIMEILLKNAIETKMVWQRIHEISHETLKYGMLYPIYHMWEYSSVLSYIAHCFHIYFSKATAYERVSKVILCLKTSYISKLWTFSQNVCSLAIVFFISFTLSFSHTVLSLKGTICNLNHPFGMIFNCKWNHAWPVNCWNVR